MHNIIVGKQFWEIFPMKIQSFLNYNFENIIKVKREV